MVKAKVFTEEEKRALAVAGLDWRLCKLVQRTPSGMIIKDRITDKVKLIEKRQIPS